MILLMAAAPPFLPYDDPPPIRSLSASIASRRAMCHVVFDSASFIVTGRHFCEFDRYPSGIKMPRSINARSGAVKRSALRKVLKMSVMRSEYGTVEEPAIIGSSSSRVHPDSPGDFPLPSFLIAYMTSPIVHAAASLVSIVIGSGRTAVGYIELNFCSRFGFVSNVMMLSSTKIFENNPLCARVLQRFVSSFVSPLDVFISIGLLDSTSFIHCCK